MMYLNSTCIENVMDFLWWTGIFPKLLWVLGMEMDSGKLGMGIVYGIRRGLYHSRAVPKMAVKLETQLTEEWVMTIQQFN